MSTNVIGLLPNRFQQAAQIRNSWSISASVDLDTVLEPTYWRNVSSNLKPYDRIEVIHEQGEYWAELLVRSVGRHSAKVDIITAIEPEEVQADAEIDDLKVAWAGPHAKFRVLRSTPEGKGEVLAEGIASKAEAIARMIELSQEAAA